VVETTTVAPTVGHAVLGVVIRAGSLKFIINAFDRRQAKFGSHCAGIDSNTAHACIFKADREEGRGGGWLAICQIVIPGIPWAWCSRRGHLAKGAYVEPTRY
jgi:hypothetical protein